MKWYCTSALFTALVTLLVADAHAGLRGQGLKIGVNRATLAGEDADRANASSVYEPVLGGFLTFDISDDLSIQPEFLYSRKGSQGDSLGIQGRVTIDYLELPVLLRLDGSTKARFTPTVFVGLAMAFRINAEGEIIVNGNTLPAGLDQETRSTDFSYLLGVAAHFDVGRGKAFVEGRFTRGIRSIENEGRLDIQNSVFSITLGYFFTVDE